MEVDSFENSENFEDSLSKSISSSDPRTSETKLNEYGKSRFTLRRSRRVEIGSKTSQRKSHKPSTNMKIYDEIDLTREHCPSNYHISDEFSKLFVLGSEDLPKFILKYTFKPINVQGDRFCGYRTVSHDINNN
ncbi:hypothetical protein O181_059539 [Austropuccinia psidii MF-1]|uniref:Uncharacterized protein n=1 Tax=Austropuccinia psidii MF-1 TaxID=1389203 RepID=A0A9Q3EEG6_9BASI|nr:hypothetical protein [Austropuccinia psidii MF-1]